MQTAFSGITNKEPLFPALQLRKNSVVQTAVNKNSDEVAIGLLTPEKTQALLNRQIAEKLSQRFKDEGIELSGLQAADFTPEKVSERILGFVSGQILAEQDSARQTELMAQARKGIEQGFSEAREILESLDVLNGQVKEDVDSTYDLIQQGLARLEEQINGTLVDSEVKKGTAQVQQAAMQRRFSRNENTRVEITTRDGDMVLIDLFKQQSAQSSHTFSRHEDGDSMSIAHTLSARSGISYQVQGELDEDEQKAIDNLLKDVAKVSDSFFSGNVQKAFKTAINMDFDSEELTRFSLNLDYQESRQVAINTYSEYQSQSRPENGEHAFAQAGLKDMSDFIQQLQHLLQNPFAVQKFSRPEQAIGDLLKDMKQLLHSDEMKKMRQDSSDLLDSIVNELKSSGKTQETASKIESTNALA